MTLQQFVRKDCGFHPEHSLCRSVGSLPARWLSAVGEASYHIAQQPWRDACVGLLGSRSEVCQQLCEYTWKWIV